MALVSFTKSFSNYSSNMLKTAAALHASLDIAAIEGLGPDDWEEPPPRDLNDTWTCAAHGASLAVHDLFDADGSAPESIKSLITRVRESCKQFHASANKATALSATQEKRNRKILQVSIDVILFDYHDYFYFL